MEKAFESQMKELYDDKTLLCLRDDLYLVNLDYFELIKDNNPYAIRVCLKPGSTIDYEKESLTRDSPTCKKLVGDSAKRIEIKLIKNTITEENWNGAVSYIKTTLRQYAVDYGRVCIRNIQVVAQKVGDIKTLSISVYYGHYMYSFALD